MQKVVAESTFTNSQEIQNALIQWGTNDSTTSDQQTFDFAIPFGSANSAVAVNRTQPNASAILPVVSSGTLSYQIDRSSSVNGDQYFNMLAIGSNTNDNAQVSDVIIGGQRVATIQWGTAETTKDKNQSFSFHQNFDGGCFAVITNRQEANSKSNLAVVSIDSSSFTVNRATSTNGNEGFFWIAIGNCAANSAANFSFSIGDYTIKGGIAYSSYDSSQTISFESLGLDNFESSCETVVTTRTKSGSQDILPVTGKTINGFTIDRPNSIDYGQYFYWIAVGS